MVLGVFNIFTTLPMVSLPWLIEHRLKILKEKKFPIDIRPDTWKFRLHFDACSAFLFFGKINGLRESILFQKIIQFFPTQLNIKFKLVPSPSWTQEYPSQSSVSFLIWVGRSNIDSSPQRLQCYALQPPGSNSPYRLNKLIFYSMKVGLRQ